jgi:prepilin-type N-terminal cleavage/methylation domain-containing protein
MMGFGRRGFSLIELLVVVGIIAILLAILLPAMSGMRVAARRAVCSSRLRDLSLACIQYRDQHGRFPEPQRQGMPHQFELRLINELSPYLRYPTVATGASAADLPLHVQCPFIEEIEVDRGPTVAPAEVGGSQYYTGYMYLAGLERIAVNQSTEESSATTQAAAAVAVLLKPERTARARETRRALIWADDIHLTLAPQLGWNYAHPYANWIGQSTGFAGQHLAYNDGSVEWRPKEKLDVAFQPEEEQVKPRRGRKKLREAAAYVVNDTYYWW